MGRLVIGPQFAALPHGLKSAFIPCVSRANERKQKRARRERGRRGGGGGGCRQVAATGREFWGPVCLKDNLSVPPLRTVRASSSLQACDRALEGVLPTRVYFQQAN